MEYKEFPSNYFSDNKSAELPSPDKLDRTIAPFRRYLAEFVKNLPKNAKVLDAGCGSGKASFMIRIYRPDVEIHAIDISDVGGILPNWIDFKKGSVEDVDTIYPAGYFDAIVSLHVIEHLIFPIKMINAFRMVLKPGGKVFFETPNWTRLFIPFSHMFFWNDYTHVRPFSPFAMNKLLLEAEFTPEKIISRSSNIFFVKTDDRFISKIKSANVKKPKVYNVKTNSRIIEVSKSIFRRLVNPLMRDTLIAIARK